MPIPIDLWKSTDGVPISAEQHDEDQTKIENAFGEALPGTGMDSITDQTPGRYMPNGAWGLGLRPSSTLTNLYQDTSTANMFFSTAADTIGAGVTGYGISLGRAESQRAVIQVDAVTGAIYFHRRYSATPGEWEARAEILTTSVQFPTGPTQATALAALGLTIPAFTSITPANSWTNDTDATAFKSAWRKTPAGIDLVLALNVGNRTANTTIAILTQTMAFPAQFRYHLAGVGNNGTLVPLVLARSNSGSAVLTNLLAVPAGVASVHFAGVLPV